MFTWTLYLSSPTLLTRRPSVDISDVPAETIESATSSPLISNLSNKPGSYLSSCYYVLFSPPRNSANSKMVLNILVPATAASAKAEACVIHQVRYLVVISLLTSMHSQLASALPGRFTSAIVFTTGPFGRPSSTQSPPTITLQSSVPATSGVSVVLLRLKDDDQ